MHTKPKKSFEKLSRIIIKRGFISKGLSLNFETSSYLVDNKSPLNFITYLSKNSLNGLYSNTFKRNHKDKANHIEIFILK